MTRSLVLALLITCAPLSAALGQETSPKGYIEMPKAEDRAWVLTSKPGSGRNWGKPVFIRFLALVAREWRRRHPELPRVGAPAAGAPVGVRITDDARGPVAGGPALLEVGRESVGPASALPLVAVDRCDHQHAGDTGADLDELDGASLD